MMVDFKADLFFFMPSTIVGLLPCGDGAVRAVIVLTYICQYGSWQNER